MFLKLSFLYFFYFALLGALAPYLGLYLDSLGFNLLDIAQLTSLMMLTKIFAPFLWATISDKYQCHLLMVRFGALMTLVCYLAFFVVDSFWGLAMCITLFSFFWNAVLPQVEVIALYSLGEKKLLYSRIRLWGSIGFIVSVVLLGVLFDFLGIRYFPVSVLLIILTIFMASLMAFDEPDADEHRSDVEVGFWQQVGRSEVVVFFAICFLLQLSHGAYYTYFSIFLESLGYEKSIIGFLWGLGVLAEVLLFIYMHRWFAVQQLGAIISLSLLVTVFRWGMTAYFADRLWVLILLQCIHALSFGAMHAAAIHFVHREFTLLHQGRAQAIYSSVGFGLGGVAGAMLSGCVVTLGGYAHAFLLSAVVALIAYVLSTRFDFNDKSSA